MAKKKGAAHRPKPQMSKEEWASHAEGVRRQFKEEIKYLMDLIPAKLWEGDICGLCYEFLPWHDYSSIIPQTGDDDPHEPPAWQYHTSFLSDFSRLQGVAEFYHSELDYHRLLIEAGKAFLDIDFAPYGQITIEENGFPYGPFRLQVYDADGSFRLNYCEFVLANRL